jgi:hypothetical protein
MIYNIADANLSRRFRKLFLLDGIKTNLKLWNPPDVLGSVLRKDPGNPKKRPMVPVDEETLVVDYNEIVHADILKKRPGTVMIRYFFGGLG